MKIKLGYANMWATFLDERMPDSSILTSDIFNKKNINLDNVPIWEKAILQLGHSIEIYNPFKYKCDIVIRGPFDHDSSDFVGRPIVIEYSGESTLLGDFNYSISHEPTSKTNLYLPLFLLRKDRWNITLSNLKVNNPTNRKFCSCLISNSSWKTWQRLRLFNTINKYKKVDSGGTFKNNIGYRVNDKNIFITNYKFYFCSENININGYITEKIIDGFSNGCVPIYYGGGNKIFEIFNKDAFICCNGKSRRTIIKEIRDVDQDDNKYLQMINADNVIRKDYLDIKYKELQNFLNRIICYNLPA